MSSITRRTAITLLAAGWLGAPLAAQPVVFDFETIPAGTPTPFCDARSGLTACFAASHFFGPTGLVHDFGRGPGGIPGIEGHVLGAMPPADPFAPQISIGFNGPPSLFAPPSNISFDFMITLVGATPVPIQLDAFLGPQHVKTCTAVGSPFSLFPGSPADRQVGTLQCSPGPFSDVSLGTQFGDFVNFYVDNIAVNAPEPTSFLLLAAGLVAAAGVAYRRRRPGWHEVNAP